MSLKCIAATIATYSPAGVLFVWAAVLSDQDHKMSKGTLVFFLVILGITVVAAETARIYKRRAIRRERDR